VTQYNVGTANPFHLVYAGAAGQGAIVNLDLTNTIIVAQSEGEAYQGLGNINNFVVGPLNYIVVDGSLDYWVIAQSGSPLVDWMPGVTNWAPSPVQAAAQIIASGLATSANQVTQIGQETTTATNTGTIATNTAATETAVTTVNTTLGNPAQNNTVVNPNPNLFNGSIVGYITLLSAGSGIALASPAPLPGCPAAYALSITPSGTVGFAGTAGGAFNVTPGQAYQARGAICLPFTDANLTNAIIGIEWYSDQAGTVPISHSTAFLPVPPANQWVWLNSGSPGFTAPGTAVTARITMQILGSSAIAVSDVFETAVMTVTTALPGNPAQEGTLAQIHDRIANTGAPNLVFAQQLVSEPANTALTSGTPVNTATVPVNQPSYDGYISISTSAAGPVYVTFNLNWLQNGIVIATEVWNIICGTAANPHIIFPKGPTKGDHLQIEIISFSANATLVGFQMYQHSRDYRFDDWRSVQCNAFQGASAPFSNAPGLELGYRIIAAQGAGATDNIALPLFAGRVRLEANTASGTNDLGITITDVGSPGTTNGEVVYAAKSDSTGNINADINLPRSTVQISMHNGNAAAQETRWAVIIEEY
jgi:hypothetical protein